LDGVRAASAGLDMALPIELVQQYVDAGRSPDAFAAELHERVARSASAVQAKQRAFGRLEEAIRHQMGELNEPVKSEDAR
jgi:hypothetical protein